MVSEWLTIILPFDKAYLQDQAMFSISCTAKQRYWEIVRFKNRTKYVLQCQFPAASSRLHYCKLTCSCHSINTLDKAKPDIFRAGDTNKNSIATAQGIRFKTKVKIEAKRGVPPPALREGASNFWLKVTARRLSEEIPQKLNLWHAQRQQHGQLTTSAASYRNFTLQPLPKGISECFNSWS